MKDTGREGRGTEGGEGRGSRRKVKEEIHGTAVLFVGHFKKNKKISN